ncbi:MAG: uroporphyrinogen synthase [Leptospiraceae bacterium]|nr:uroporphyrinogen synthase [Leptospiraceae bacterium]
MSGRLVTGSRKSALARLQAYHVVAAIQKRHPGLRNEFYFRESVGDADQKTPLWQMDGQGVFTAELTADLEAGSCDLVVHSHKDLETATRKKTEVWSALPRADARDLILFKRSWLETGSKDKLTIYTSSPRRQYNLLSLLPRVLPKSKRPQSLDFAVIRGNIQTRLRKFMESEGNALIMAKAALDRILATDFKESADAEFVQIRAAIQTVLQDCEFMVLPLSANPCAPAQGAFACEFRTDDARVREMVEDINHRITEDSVWRERQILAQYGGGCHQKIGVAHIPLGGRSVTFVRGETDGGEKLDQAIIDTDTADSYVTKTEKASNWPPADWQMPDSMSMLWEIDHDQGRAFYDDRDNSVTRETWIATAHLQAWFNAAEADEWITATADSMGWAHVPDLSLLAV